jgi:hypothetical protein
VFKKLIRQQPGIHTPNKTDKNTTLSKLDEEIMSFMKNINKEISPVPDNSNLKILTGQTNKLEYRDVTVSKQPGCTNNLPPNKCVIHNDIDISEKENKGNIFICSCNLDFNIDGNIYDEKGIIVGTHEDDGYIVKGPVDFYNDEYLLQDLYENNCLDTNINNPNEEVASPATPLVYKTNQPISLGSDTDPEEEMAKKYTLDTNSNNSNEEVASPATPLVYKIIQPVSLNIDTESEVILAKKHLEGNIKKANDIFTKHFYEEIQANKDVQVKYLNNEKFHQTILSDVDLDLTKNEDSLPIIVPENIEPMTDEHLITKVVPPELIEDETIKKGKIYSINKIKDYKFITAEQITNLLKASKLYEYLEQLDFEFILKPVLRPFFSSFLNRCIEDTNSNLKNNIIKIKNILEHKKLFKAKIFSVGTSEKFIQSLMTLGDPKNPFLMPLIINNFRIIGEVDSGASYTIISQDILEKINPNYESDYESYNSKILYGVTGQKIDLLVDRKLPIFIPSLGSLNFRVSVTTTPKVLLIGRDFMAATRMNIINCGVSRWKISFNKTKSLEMEQKHSKNKKDLEWTCDKGIYKIYTCYNRTDSGNMNHCKKIMHSLTTPIEVKPKLKKSSNKLGLNFQKILAASNIQKIYQFSQSSKTFDDFLLKLENNRKHINIQSTLKVISECIDSKSNCLNLPKIDGEKFTLFTQQFSELLEEHIENFCENLNDMAPNLEFLEYMFSLIRNYTTLSKLYHHITFQNLFLLEIQLLLLVRDIQKDIKRYLEQLYKYRIKNVSQIQNINIDEDLSSRPSPDEENELLTDDMVKLKINCNENMGVDIDQFYFDEINEKQSISDIFGELSHIDDEKSRQELAEFMYEKQIVSLSEFDLGGLPDHIPKLDLRLLPGKSVPQNTKGYRLDLKDEAEVGRFMANLVHLGLAKHSDPRHNWGSPIFLLKGKNGKRNRIIFDLRKVNSVISAEFATALPEVFHMLKEIAPKAKYVSSIDLRQCFYALKCTDQTIDSGLLNVTCNSGNYTLLRCITGLASVPSYLVTILNTYLHEDDEGNQDYLMYVLIFYDDINIFTLFGETYKSHKDKVKTVMHRIARLNLKINLAKCRFYIDLTQQSLRILGYLIGKGKIAVPEEKVEALKLLKEPSSLKNLQSLLGSLNYYKPIFDLRIQNSMHYLYKRIRNFSWDEIARNHYKTIMKGLRDKAMYLEQPFKRQCTILFTDSSMVAMGGCLLSYNLDEIIKKIEVPSSPLPVQAFNQFLIKEKIQCNYLTKDKCFLKCVLEGLRLIHFQCPRIESLYKQLIINLIRYTNIFIKLLKNVPLCKNELKYTENVKLLYHIDYENIDKEENLFEIIILSLTYYTTMSFNLHTYHPDTGFTVKNFGSQTDTVNILFFEGMYYFLYFSEENKYGKTYLHMSKGLITGTKVKEHFFDLLASKNEERGEEKNRNIRIIGYHSKIIDVNLIKKSSICFLELYSILENLEHFESTLNSQEFTVVLTDSRVCQQLLNNKKTIDRDTKLQSLAQKIQFWYRNNNLYFVSVEGKKNISDMLSRLLPERFENLSLEPILPDYKSEFFEVFPFTERKINKQKETINIIKAYINKVKTTPIPYKSVPHFANTYLDLYKVILRKPTFIQFQLREAECEDQSPHTLKRVNNKILLPKPLVMLIVGFSHLNLNHPGIKRLYDYINKFYHCSDKTYLLEQVTLLCKQCMICFRCKRLIHNREYGSSDRNLLYKPNQLLLADLFEGFSLLGNRHGGDSTGTKSILVLFDLFSHCIFLHPLGAKTQNAVIHRLTSHFSILGPVRYLLTDNASIFRGRNIRSFCKEVNVSLLESAAMSSYSRGCIERQVQRLLHEVKKKTYKEDHIAFCKSMSKSCFAMNIIPLNKTFLCPLNIHFHSLLSFSSPMQDEDSNLSWPVYIDTGFHMKPEYKEMAEKLQQEVLKFRDELVNEKKDRLDKLNKNKKKHNLRLWDFCLVQTFSKTNKALPDYGLNIYQVIKVRDITITVRCILTGREHAYRNTNLKKLDQENIQNIDLPTSLLDELCIITPESFNKLLVQNVPGPVQPRRSNRILLKHNPGAVDMEEEDKSTQVLNKQIYDDEDQLDEFELKLIDQIDLLMTVHEQDGE